MSTSNAVSNMQMVVYDDYHRMKQEIRTKLMLGRSDWNRKYNALQRRRQRGQQLPMEFPCPTCAKGPQQVMYDGCVIFMKTEWKENSEKEFIVES